MSKINLYNYEAYYLDYLEGNLSVDDIAQLFLFLDQNSKVKSEVKEIEIIRLNSNYAVTFDKEKLYQHINESNVEDYIISSIEQQIDEEDETELAAYLKSSSEAKTLAERYRKTILSKPLIRFPGKIQLKKKVTPVYYLTPMLAAAASLLVFLVIHPFLAEKVVTPTAFHHAKSSISDTVQSKRIEVVIREAVKTNKTRIAILKKSNIKSSKQNTTLEMEIQKSEATQTTVSGIIEELPEFTIPGTGNKTMMHAGNYQLPVDTTEKNQMLEYKKLTSEYTSAENCENKKKLKIAKVNSKGFKIWRVAKLGVKVIGKLNERDIALGRDIIISGSTINKHNNIHIPATYHN